MTLYERICLALWLASWVGLFKFSSTGGGRVRRVVLGRGTAGPRPAPRRTASPTTRTHDITGGTTA